MMVAAAAMPHRHRRRCRHRADEGRATAAAAVAVVIVAAAASASAACCASLSMTIVVGGAASAASDAAFHTTLSSTTRGRRSARSRHWGDRRRRIGSLVGGRDGGGVGIVAPFAPTPNANAAAPSSYAAVLFGASTGNDETDSNAAAGGAAPQQQSAQQTEPLSDVDARVLQSILDEGKIDMQTEEDLRKLLERGTAPKTAATGSGGKAKKEEGKNDKGYSSRVIKTFSDNEFWNSLKAKTSDVLESAKMFLSNRVQQDSKLLGALGLFAWERAKRDVARALPAAGSTGQKVGKAVRNQVLKLAANSSFVEQLNMRQDSNFLLGPAWSDEENEQRRSGSGSSSGSDLYDELNTPLDEIKSVTESVKDILSGKTIPSSFDGDAFSPSSSSSSRRGLKSVAPAGVYRNAERQQRAYQRRKATVLQREKERLDQKFGRTVGTVTDSVYEMQREMQTEGNEPGYKSESVRNAIEASAAAALLEAGDAVKGGWGQLPLGIGRTSLGTDERGTVRRELKGMATAAEVVPEGEEVVEEGSSSSFWGGTEEVITAQADADSAIPKTAKKPLFTTEDLVQERTRLTESLRLCLEQPAQTWLLPDWVSGRSAGGGADDDDLREVIAAMIDARHELEVALSRDARRELEGALRSSPSADDTTSLYSDEELVDELERMKGAIDAIALQASDAAGDAAADLLKKELYGVNTAEGCVSLLASFNDLIEYTSDTVDDAARSFNDPAQTISSPYFASEATVVEPSVQVQATTSTYQGGEEPYRDPWSVDATFLDDDVTELRPIDELIVTEEGSSQTPAAGREEFPSQVVDVVVEAAEIIPDVIIEGMQSVEEEDDDDSNKAVVEIITDDFEGVVVNIENAEAVHEDDDNSNKGPQEDNLFVKVTLRTLDVFFFVAEKALTVGLPGIFSVGKTVSSRMEKVQRNGLGYDGWKLLENVQDGAKRY